MECVFEGYVTRHCASAWGGKGGGAVAVQPLFRPARPVAGQPDVSMRPDLTLDRAGRTALVVDAKWKRLKPTALVTSDLYQVLAYCAALGVERAALVYPGRRDRRWRYHFPRSPVRVVVQTLRVVGSREACLASVRRLGRALLQGVE
jgi:5-methylcytosine-specific restriction enzyme subunit McrC